MGGPDMGGLILYGACNGGPGIVRNVPNPAQNPRENFEKSVTSVSHAISTSSTSSVLYFAVALTYQAKYKKAKSELT